MVHKIKKYKIFLNGRYVDEVALTKDNLFTMGLVYRKHMSVSGDKVSIKNW